MSRICTQCGKSFEDQTGDDCCPACKTAHNDTLPVSAVAPSENTFETVADLSGGLPIISAVESADDAYLKKGVMTPPNRPGIRGSLGRFELLKLLGRGGMGYVYLAREPLTDTQVAVKVLRQELTEHPKVTKYFMTEARHMYSMSHPNILKVLEVSESDRGPFFVMPYVRGGSLRDRLADQKPLDRGEIIPICIQVAKGLVYAHSRGLIHRDLKPDNLLIDDQEQVMITDFGLVRSFLDDSMLDVSQKSAEGTPAYMSPGVAAGQAEDTRCDIYAFGALMYEMLTGKLPYNGPSAEDILEAIRTGPPPAILKVHPDANKDLTRIAEAAMARELRDRYATMDDVLQDLERVSQQQHPIGPHAQAVRRRIVPGLAKVLLPALGLLVLGLLIRNYTQAPPESAPPAPPTAVPPPPTPKPLTADEAYRKGVTALNDGDLPLSESLLAQTVTLDPLHVEAWNKLGDSYLAQGKTLSARISYDRVLRLKGNDMHALLGLAEAFNRENQPREYTRFLTLAFRLEPANADLAEELLTQLAKVGHYQSARAMLNLWKQYDPDNPATETWEVKVKEMEENPPVSSYPPPPPRPQTNF